LVAACDEVSRREELRCLIVSHRAVPHLFSLARLAAAEQPSRFAVAGLDRHEGTYAEGRLVARDHAESES